jgi:hypothetical protein
MYKSELVTIVYSLSTSKSMPGCFLLSQLRKEPGKLAYLLVLMQGPGIGNTVAVEAGGGGHFVSDLDILMTQLVIGQLNRAIVSCIDRRDRPLKTTP